MKNAVASSADHRKDEILAKLKKFFGEESIPKYSADFFCDWLPGDASNRFYGRLKFKDQASLMLMVMNEPEAFKSEEASGENTASIKELPFVTIARELDRAGVRVPKVVGVGPQSEFLVCEDLGDELLYLRRQKEKALDWYKKALDELVVLQRAKAFHPVDSRSFTKELLSWEAEHFVEYAILKREKKISGGLISELRNFNQKLVDAMSSSSYVLVHRDYHSKNLLVLENERRVGVIDFQDALSGPRTYDLASLLRDSYVRLGADEEEELLRYFESSSKSSIDRKLFAMTSLQRNLKAVGRFYYISIVKGRDTHLPFVKPSLLRIFQTLRDLNEVRILSILEGLFQSEVA